MQKHVSTYIAEVSKQLAFRIDLAAHSEAHRLRQCHGIERNERLEINREKVVVSRGGTTQSWYEEEYQKPVPALAVEIYQW